MKAAMLLELVICCQVVRISIPNVCNWGKKNLKSWRTEYVCSWLQFSSSGVVETVEWPSIRAAGQSSYRLAYWCTCSFARVWRWDLLGSALPQQLSLMFLKRKENAAFIVIIALQNYFYLTLNYLIAFAIFFLNYFVISNIVGVPAYLAVNNLYIITFKVLR